MGLVPQANPEHFLFWHSVKLQTSIRFSIKIISKIHQIFAADLFSLIEAEKKKPKSHTKQISIHYTMSQNIAKSELFGS